MTSDQEKVLFEQYGWTHDHIGRRWVSPNGRMEISVDFIVQLTQEPDGDLHLMRAIVSFGERDAERGG